METKFQQAQNGCLISAPGKAGDTLLYAEDALPTQMRLFCATAPVSICSACALEWTMGICKNQLSVSPRTVEAFALHISRETGIPIEAFREALEAASHGRLPQPIRDKRAAGTHARRNAALDRARRVSGRFLDSRVGK